MIIRMIWTPFLYSLSLGFAPRSPTGFQRNVTTVLIGAPLNRIKYDKQSLQQTQLRVSTGLRCHGVLSVVFFLTPGWLQTSHPPHRYMLR